MTIQYVTINKTEYRYFKPDNWEHYRFFLRQKKQIQEKIRACQSGCYAGKVSRKGKPYYQDYPEFLSFLETLS